MSPAMKLMKLVWDQCGGRSWSEINDAMQQALALAVDCGFKFAKDDFSQMYSGFGSGYWIGTDNEHNTGERWYSRACAESSLQERTHGGNPSAAQSFESWKGRKPFIIRDRRHASGQRICIGREFQWPDSLPCDEKTKLLTLKCTSFAADGQSLTACWYVYEKPTDGSTYGKHVPKRRFKIGHDDIKAWHKELDRANKAVEQEKPCPPNTQP